MVIVVLLFLILSFFTPLSGAIRNSVLHITSPVQKVLFRQGGNTKQIIDIIRNTTEVKEEIYSLRRENRRLDANIAQLSEVEAENKALRKAMEIDFIKEVEHIYAEVIGQGIDRNHLIIRHTKKPAKNSPVITPEGVFIGVIEESYNTFSQIRLVTSEKSSFEVKVQGEEEPLALLRGQNENTLLLELLPKDTGIRVGDRVVGLTRDEIDIRGILIGHIKSIEKSDIEAFARAKVKPAFDFHSFDRLFVIGGAIK